MAKSLNGEVSGSNSTQYQIPPGNAIAKHNERCRAFRNELVVILASIIAIIMLSMLVMVMVVVPIKANNEIGEKNNCSCSVKFEETRPLRLYNGSSTETTEIIENLIKSSAKEIFVVGWLPPTTNKLRNIEAERVFEGLIKKAQENVYISIILNTYETENLNLNSILNKIRNTTNVNISMNEKELQQTLLIIDDTDMYLSTAPIGQTTTFRKESAIKFWGCPCLVQDVKKIVNQIFPTQLANAEFKQRPLNVLFNDTYEADFNFTTSLNISVNRISPEDTFISTVSQAEKFIYIVTTEYDPNISTNSSKRIYWSLIDDHLRSAASNNVTVRILASKTHNKNPYLESLSKLPGLEVKLLIIPSKSNDIDLNQDRFMVTERGLYYGMPKLSGDDFISSLTIGFVLEDTLNQRNTNKTLRETIVESFDHHWTSDYAITL